MTNSLTDLPHTSSNTDRLARFHAKLLDKATEVRAAEADKRRRQGALRARRKRAKDALEAAK